MLCFALEPGRKANLCEADLCPLRQRHTADEIKTNEFDDFFYNEIYHFILKNKQIYIELT
jgi:hypothetical protein